MTLHHLQQRTHPLGFDWLIPQGGQDEGYFVGSFESQLHTTHTRVRFFSPATSGAPQRPTLQDQRERTRGLQLASPATTVNQTVSANSATCTITARSTTASPLTEANTFPARARTFALETPATCSLPEFLYLANTSIQAVVKSYY